MNISFSGAVKSIYKPETASKKAPSGRENTPRSAYNLPSGITVDSGIKCYPNIRTLTPEQLFDVQYAGGTKLSDGSVLIRPVNLSLGDVDIRPSEEGKKSYDITVSSPSNMYAETPSSVTMSLKEEELIKNKNFCRGLLKPVDDKTYSLSFIDINGEPKTVKADKRGCLKVLRDNLLYM